MSFTDRFKHMMERQGPDNPRNPKVGRYTKGPFPGDSKGQKTPDDYVEPSDEEKFDNLVEIFAESSLKADLTSPSEIERLIKQLMDIKQYLPDVDGEVDDGHMGPPGHVDEPRKPQRHISRA